MGSYCGIQDEKTGKFIYSEHKFFGYIDDEEIENLFSFRFLVSKFKDLEFVLNISYIGAVAELTPKETETFMKLYAIDYGCDFVEMWGIDLTDLKIENSCIISFD